MLINLRWKDALVVLVIVRLCNKEIKVNHCAIPISSGNSCNSIGLSGLIVL